MKCPIRVTVALAATISAVYATASCTFDSFESRSFYGGAIQSVRATDLANITQNLTSALILNSYPFQVSNLSVCQVDVVYTHPGWNDTVNVTVWLPKNWNGRYMGIGGGGFATGTGASSVNQPAALGYSPSSTDGGHDGGDYHVP